MSLASFFTTVENDVVGFFHNPTVQNLEAEFEKDFIKVIGFVPWNKLKDSIVPMLATGLTEAEAHNKLIALAASFVPGGNLAIATMIASGAANVVSGALQAVPVPPASVGPISTPAPVEVAPSVKIVESPLDSSGVSGTSVPTPSTSSGAALVLAK